MLSALLVLVAALTSPSVQELGDGTVAHRAAPLARLMSYRTVDGLLPRTTTVEHVLLTDAEGEATAIVTTRSILGTLRQVHERETVFADTGLRILHTEEVTPTERRLVWRELRPTGARTWIATWDAGGAHVTAYGWHRPVHEPLAGFDAAAGAVLGPLELQHRLRTGARVPGGSCLVVDPSAARVLRVSIGAGPDGVEIRREDGSLVAGLLGDRTWFHGGADRARAVDGEEAERRRGRWIVPSRPAHELVLARIRAGDLRR